MNNLALLMRGSTGEPRFTQSIVRTDTGLDVVFADGGEPVSFSWFWLRDHGVDDASLDPATLQRRVDTFTIPGDIAPSDVAIDEANEEILIDWPDAPQTRITGHVLASAVGRVLHTRDLASPVETVLWGKDAPLADSPAVTFDAVINTEAGRRAWVENIVRYGFSVVDGVPSTEAATRALAESISRVHETIFGRMWMLSAELEDHGDSAYSTQYLEPHTDSSYYHNAPGLQMFNCLEFAGKGGESVQVDGFAIAERIREQDPEAWELLTQIRIPAHYIEPGVHLRAERPTLRLNSQGELVQVTWNNYDRAPFVLPPGEEKAFYRAYGVFHEHVMDQDNWHKIPLRPGKVLIFDNWRNLHGRMGYVGKRVFSGCYLSRAQFESTLRVMLESD